MEPPTFRGKPSDDHVVWRRSGGGDGGPKRFDEERLCAWCSAVGAEYETDRRVDHERGDDPRQQHRVVFAWTEGEGESFDMGDEEWEIATQETPATFIELDEQGEARLKTWTDEYVFDVQELWLDDTAFVFRAAGLDDPKQLDARELTTEPE